MPYNPNLYMPQGYQPYRTGPGDPMSQPSWTPNYPMAQMQQPIDALIGVTGLEGAKAYQIPPNSKVALFDSDSDVFYVKTTDAGGFPTIRSFSFAPIEQAAPQAPAEDFVPRSEFDALVQEVRKLAGMPLKRETTDGE
jgi:hypothetical protein